jgi:hypothetical protein
MWFHIKFARDTQIRGIWAASLAAYAGPERLFWQISSTRNLTNVKVEAGGYVNLHYATRREVRRPRIGHCGWPEVSGPGGAMTKVGKRGRSLVRWVRCSLTRTGRPAAHPCLLGAAMKMLHHSVHPASRGYAITYLGQRRCSSTCSERFSLRPFV